MPFAQGGPTPHLAAAQSVGLQGAMPIPIGIGSASLLSKAWSTRARAIRWCQWRRYHWVRVEAPSFFVAFVSKGKRKLPQERQHTNCQRSRTVSWFLLPCLKGIIPQLPSSSASNSTVSVVNLH